MSPQCIVLLFLSAYVVGARRTSIGCSTMAFDLLQTGACELHGKCFVHCESSCLRDNDAHVYGTVYYSWGSSVCKSALHDLRISAWDMSARDVYLVIALDERKDFSASTRYGVTSERSDGSSFYFHFESPRINEDVLDITALHRNFIYGEEGVSQLECHGPEGRPIRFDYAIKEIPFQNLILRPIPVKGVYSLKFPKKSFPHSRTNLFWCQVEDTTLSYVGSPAMYYDRTGGPHFLPLNYTVTASLDQMVTLEVTKVPGDDGESEVSYWAKVDAAGLASEIPSSTGAGSTLWTAQNARLQHNGVYVANGNKRWAPGKNRAIFRVIVRTCADGFYGHDCKFACPKCQNGGVCHDITGQCICPPGFRGELCNVACGDDYFGKDCTRRCSDTNENKEEKTCRGILMCLPDPYGCSCGTGFYGPFCDQTCPPHRYGADCKQSRVCYCETKEHCDIHTGTCQQDHGRCRRGWKNSPFCDQSYPLLIDGPAVSAVTNKEATVTFRQWRYGVDVGEGNPLQYSVQYRAGSEKWTATTINAAEKTYTALLKGLRSDTYYDVRVLVIDQDQMFREIGAKITGFRTTCGEPKLPPQNVVINNSTTSEVIVRWTNPGKETWQCWTANVVLQVNDTSIEFNLTESSTTPTNVYRIPVAPYTAVTIRLRLRTPDNKNSSWTKTWTVTSAEDAPGVVTFANLLRSGSRNALVFWGPPEKRNGVIRRYRVVYAPMTLRIPSCLQLTQRETELIVPPTHESTFLAPLRPYTKYRFSVAAFTVKYGPALNTTFDTEEEVPEGAPTQLKHTQSSRNIDTVTWGEVPCEQRNGPITSYYVETDSIDPWETEVRHKTVTGTSLTYRDLLPYTKYRVKVYAENGAGRSSMFASLNFTTASTGPYAPGQLEFKQLFQDTILLTWKAPYPPTGVFEHYKLKYGKAKSPEKFNETVISYTLCNASNGEPRPCFAVRNLEADTLYRFSVCAKNIGTEYSPYSQEVEAETKEMAPGVVPFVDVVRNGSRNVTVSSGPPEIRNGVIRNYRITYSPVTLRIPHCQEIPELETELLVPATNLSVILTGLRPYTNYRISVAAFTVDYGPELNATFGTDEAIPEGAPTHLHHATHPPNMDTLTWAEVPCELRNGPIVSYHLEMHSVDPWETQRRNSTVNSTFVTYRDLMPYTGYRVKVYAENSAGRSSMFASLNFTTAPAPPHAPGHLEYEQLFQDTIRLTWEAPYPPTGILEHYRIKYGKLTTPEEFNETVINHTMCHARNREPRPCFTVRDLEVDMLHHFSVCAKNIGTDYSPYSEQVEVQTREMAPGVLPFVDVLRNGPRKATLSWGPPEIKNGVIRGYRITYTPEALWIPYCQEIPQLETELLVPATNHSVVLTGLRPYTSYRISVAARTIEYGPGLNATFDTDEAIPEGTPTLLKHASSPANIDTLSWAEVPCKRRNGPITSYYLEMESDEPWETQLRNDTLYQTSVIYSDLMPYTRYRVKVYAENGAGRSSMFTSLNFTTASAPPHAPGQLEYEQLFQDTILLRWPAPYPPTGVLQHYQLKYGKVATPANFSEIVMNHTMCQVKNREPRPCFTVRELEADHLYHFSVRAKNIDTAYSPYSEELVVETTEMAPGVLPFVDVLRNGPRNATLSWGPPEIKNGVVRGYRITYTPLALLIPSCLQVPQPETELMVPATSHSVILTGLRPYTNYRFSVAARTIEYGPGFNATFDTDQAIPEGAPTLLQHESSSPNIETLTWTEVPCERRNGPITSYYLELDSVDPWETQLRNSTVNWTSVTYRHLMPYTRYRVKVYAENGAGRSSMFASLNFTTASAPPHAPGQLEYKQLFQDSILLTWKAPYPPTGDLEHYRLKYVDVQAPDKFNVAVINRTLYTTTNGDERPCFTVRGLEANTLYRFSVSAKNTGTDYSPYSEEVEVETKEMAPGEVPFLDILQDGSSNVTASWDPPQIKNGVIRGYRVTYAPLASRIPSCEDITQLDTALVVPSTNHSVVLTGLRPYTNYRISVAALTVEYGPGLNATFDTDEDIPDGPPTNLQHASGSPNTDTLTWGEVPCEHRNGPISSYYLEMDSDDPWETQLRNSTVGWTSIAYRDLMPYTRYRVKVYAENGAGRSAKFASLNFKTASVAPHAPGHLEYEQLFQDTIRLTWEAPYPPTGVLEHYRLKYGKLTTPEEFNETVINHTMCHARNREPRPCFTVRELEADTLYHFSICAKNAGTDYSPYSEEVEVETREMVPEAPASITSSEQTEDSLKIQWEPPVRKNGVLRGYQLTSSLSHTFNAMLAKSWTSKSVSLNGSDSLEFYLRDLFPGSTYLVCIQAETSAGLGNAVCGNFSTKASIPEVQVEPRVGAIVNNTVRIVLHPVESRMGPVTGYYVVVLREGGTTIPRPVKLVNYSTAQDMGLGYYVAARLTPDQLKEASDFVVGDGDVIGGFGNPPLVDAAPYRFGLLAESNFSGEVLYGYIFTAPVIVNGDTTVIGVEVILGIALGLITLISAATALIFCCIRRRQASRQRMKSTTTGSPKERLSKLSKSNEDSMSESRMACNMESSDSVNMSEVTSGGLPLKLVPVNRLQEQTVQGQENGVLKEECM